MNEWAELLLVLGLWTVITWIAGAPACYVFWKLDRKRKNSYRCRSCGYDLRASTTNACSECGSHFQPKGIWPPGKPNRKWLVVYIFLWSWLCSSFTLLGTHLYARYIQDSVNEVWVSESVALFVNPDSGAYAGAAIELAGKEWQWVSAGDEFLVSPTQATIIFYDSSVNVVAICTFDIQDLKIQQPIDPSTQIDVVDVNGSIYGGGSTAEEVLLTGLSNNVGSFNQSAVSTEIDAMIELVRLLKGSSELSDKLSLPEKQLQDAIAKSDIEQHYQRYVQETYSIYDYTALSEWAILTPIGIGVITWIIGCYVLRKLTYARMAVGAIDTDDQASD